MKSKRSEGGGLVWSSEEGRTCPKCGWPADKCACSKANPKANPKAQPASDGVVRVRRETKGRKGKGVTVIAGVPLPPAELDALATALKKRCGSGGTVKDGNIEIQGDHRDTAIAELEKLGYTVKRAGG
jgi:translation initiation factor 1